MIYESEVLFKLMERDGFNIPSSVPPYEAEIKAYLINQVKNAYPKLTDYEAEWLLYNYTKHLPADFPISSVTNVTNASFENVVPFAYQSAILKGNTKYRDIDTGDILDTFDETKNLELVSVKVPALTTTGKNICDMVGLAETLNAISKKITIIDKTTWEISSSAAYINPDFKYRPIKFKEKTSYTISFEGQTIDSRARLANIIKIIYINGTASDMRDIGFNKLITSSNNTIDYISFSYGTSGIKEIISNLSIVEGESTSYEPHKTNILTTSEDLTLRGIGDVKDTLDCLTGEVVQNIGEIVLDGSESWNEYTSQELTNTRLFYCEVPTNSNINTSKFTVINNRFASLNPNNGGLWNTDVVGLGYGVVKNTFRLRVLKSTANTINELKEYLHSNPIVVQYELAEKSIKTVDLKTINENGESVYFMPLEGTMHVSCHSQTIPPTFDMSVPVEATTQNLASFIDLEMEE